MPALIKALIVACSLLHAWEPLSRDGQLTEKKKVYK